MNTRRVTTLVPMGLLCLLACQPVAAQLTAEDLSDLSRVEASAPNSLSSGDAATFAALFAEDVIFQPPNAPTVRGRDAVEAWARAFPKVVSLTWPNSKWHGEGDLAYVTTDYISQVEDMPGDRGKQMGVYRRNESGTWQIAAVSFNSDLPSAQNTDSRNASAVETLVAVENSKEYDRLDAVMAENFRRHGPDQDTNSRAEFKDFLRQLHTSFPDFRIEITESVHEGNSHFCHWIASGSLPATGKSFTVTGMTMHQFKDGMMTEEWAYFDAGSIQAQLNAEAVPPTR